MLHPPAPKPGGTVDAATLWEPVIHALSARFRRARAHRIKAAAPELERGRVCDLGGSLHFWETIAPIVEPADLTILNIRDDGQSKSLGTVAELGRGGRDRRIELFDGRTIPYPDGYFDCLLCHSVIEHVPVAERAALCAEMRRVARRIVVQTPAYRFPVEPHFIVPFMHWLPRPIARRLAHVSPWRLLSRVPGAHVDAYFAEIALLRHADLQALLPEARILVERFAMLPKSYLAVHAPAPLAAI